MSDINAGFDNMSAQHVDRRYGRVVAGKTVPYTSVVQALASPRLHPDYRYIGCFVLIELAGELVLHWFKDSTADVGLIPFLPSSDTSINRRLTFQLTTDGTITLPADVDLLKLRVLSDGGALVNFKLAETVSGIEWATQQDIWQEDKWYQFVINYYGATTIELSVTGIIHPTTLVFIKA